MWKVFFPDQYASEAAARREHLMINVFCILDLLNLVLIYIILIYVIKFSTEIVL